MKDPDGADQVLFVIQLLKPIKQGQTLHYWLVLQLNKNIKTEVTFDDFDAKGEQFYVLACLFKHLVKVPKVVVSGGYTGHIETQRRKEAEQGNEDAPETPIQYIRCSIKAQEGLLYPLKSSLIFVHKPVIYVKHAQINYCEFTRVLQEQGYNQASRTFDLNLVLKAEGASVDVGITSRNFLQFMSIQSNELQYLRRYFRDCKISCRDIDDEEKVEVERKGKVENDEEEEEQEGE